MTTDSTRGPNGGPAASPAASMLRHLTQHPSRIPGLVRGEFRQRVGVPLDRRRSSGKVGSPVNLDFNLTRRCNLSCTMCTQHRHGSDPAAVPSWHEADREMSLNDWVRVLDEARAFRPVLSVTGGEPTVYAHFSEVITAAAQRGFFIQLLTNGLSLTRHADLLVDQGAEVVIISLDGTREVHDSIRGQPGLFDRTIRNIRKLISVRDARGKPTPIVGLNFTITRSNMHVIPDMVPLALELGVNSLQFQHTIWYTSEYVDGHNRVFADVARSHGVDVLEPSIPRGEYYESEITAEDVPALIANLATAKRTPRGRLRLAFLPNLSDEQIAPYYLDLNHSFPGKCNSLWKTLRILPDGTVTPCLHVIAGNVRQQSLAGIWNGPVMRNYRSIISERFLPGCAHCCSRSY